MTVGNPDRYLQWGNITHVRNHRVVDVSRQNSALSRHALEDRGEKRGGTRTASDPEAASECWLPISIPAMFFDDFYGNLERLERKNVGVTL